MSAARKPKKDRTSILISVVFHAILLGAIGYWMHKSGTLELLKETILKLAQGEKKQTKEETRPIQTKAPPPPKLPPINQGYTPPSSGGTRRAVAEDAPASAAGESFFADTRAQAGGPSAAGGAGKPASNAPQAKVLLALPPPPKPVFAAPKKSTVTQLLTERAKAAASTESFGTEQIAKTGVSDAGAIVNKIAGATIVEGKFAVIRGLSDRYVTTELNGGEIPSADPYRRSASLDLFPAQIIDKVQVSKTFTPDQQGAFTGGGINIVTKSFPEKRFFSSSVGVAYNTQATGNESFLTYEGGKLDWLGMDDGTRALPDALAAEDLAVPLPPPNTPPPRGPRADPAGYRAAVQDANTLQAQTRLLGITQFAPTKSAPPLDHNLSFAMGDTTRLLMRPLGVFASMSYKREYRFYEDGLVQRYGAGVGGVPQLRNSYADERSLDVVNWSGMVNLAYQLHEEHEAGFTYLFNQNANDVVRVQIGESDEQRGAAITRNRLQFAERTLSTYQFKGKSEFPELADARVDWLAAFSETSQEEPDTRFFNYALDGGIYKLGEPYLPEPRNPTRYFRSLDENNVNLKGDLTQPFRLFSYTPGEFKLGVFSSESERTYRDREFFYEGQASFNGDPNTYLTPDNLQYIATTNPSNGRLTYSWQRNFRMRESAYLAESGIRAGYLMLDMPVLERVRLVGGVRYETTDIQVNSRSYLASSQTGETTNSATIDQLDLLPAAGLIFALRTNMNLRLNFGQTVARPSFRELAAYRSYDPITDEIIEGNPELVMTAVDNYDVRWEWFPRAGELVSVSVFQKKLRNAIERQFVTTDGEIISFENRDKAEVTGIEFEGRKSLDFIHHSLSYFSFGGNLSLIESSMKIAPADFATKRKTVPGASDTRPLYDQSPYILNLELGYDNPRIGTSATLLLNVSGPRITIASLNTEDVYEQPAPALDFILSQKLTRRLTLRFSAKNLLNPTFKRTYGKDSDFIYQSYRNGLTFGVSLSGEF